MAEFSLPTDLNLQWASSGDVLKPTDTKIQQGWQPEIPARQHFNWLDNRQDQAIAHIAQHGISVWSSTLEYQANKSYVQGSDGLIYKALTTNTNIDPVTDINFVNWIKSNSGGLIGTRVFTTVGTVVYTPSPGTSFIIVEVLGAGGAGGGTPATSVGQFAIAPGGGAGGYAKALITAGFSGVNITVGAGGVGTTGGNGSSGGTSSFGTLVSATGGGGGNLGAAFTGPSSLASANNRGTSSVTTSPTCVRIVSARGNSGGFAQGTSTSNFISGPGGPSFFGGGGDSVITASLNGGSSATVGAGGGGAGGGGGVPAFAGGAGANGIVIVTEYN